MHRKTDGRKHHLVQGLGLLALAMPAAPGHAAAQQQADSAWSAVVEAMGRTGTAQPDGVYRFSLPRSDLKVRIGGANGVAVRPALALGSWIAFRRVGDSAMAMGDLVLTERELGPVTTKLQQEKVNQTAVHHHVLHESPRVLYMHIHATGDPVRIATTVRSALELTGTPAATTPAAARASVPTGFALDTAQLALILGHRGRLNGGVYQVSVARAETIRDAGREVPPAMGVATVLNFQPTNDRRAAITGDFVLTADEVNPVIEALRTANIEVTALHNHLLHDEPRLFFMHFWAEGDALALGRGLRTALDLTNSRKPDARP